MFLDNNADIIRTAGGGGSTVGPLLKAGDQETIAPAEDFPIGTPNGKVAQNNWPFTIS